LARTQVATPQRLLLNETRDGSRRGRCDDILDALSHHLGMGGEPWFVLVSGPPASGKSTIAPLVAEEFALPLIAKDTIKDALLERLPVADVEASRELGRASVRAMLAVAAASPVGAVLESNFYRSVARGELGALPGRVIEVFCRCSQEIAEARHQLRAGSRDAGYFDQVRARDELWNDEISEPVAGGWPLIEVDTDHQVDFSKLAQRIREVISR
jgi:predicted kinase